jgi:hypothetical protein
MESTCSTTFEVVVVVMGMTTFDLCSDSSAANEASEMERGIFEDDAEDANDGCCCKSAVSPNWESIIVVTQEL